MFNIELEQEDDRRWIAEVTDLLTRCTRVWTDEGGSDSSCQSVGAASAG